jgi:ssDNA-binding Zn-finger/Zn-ribbon topoisomerase 1
LQYFSKYISLQTKCGSIHSSIAITFSETSQRKQLVAKKSLAAHKVFRDCVDNIKCRESENKPAKEKSMASYTVSETDARVYDSEDYAQWQASKKEIMAQLPGGVEVYHPEGFVIFVTE